MTDIDVELTLGRTVNLGVTTPTVSLGVDTPSIELGVDTPSITLDVNVVATSGGGGGASALADLTDVDLTPPPYNNQVLTYDDATSTWVPRYASLLFVTYLFPVGVADFYTTLGGRPADILPVAGIDGTWWFHAETTYPADNGIWVSTAAGAAEQLSPQPGGTGSSIFTYSAFDGAGFGQSYVTWMNDGGGDATDATQWTAVPVASTNVQHTKTVPADWNIPGEQTLNLMLDELAARLTALGG